MGDTRNSRIDPARETPTQAPELSGFAVMFNGDRPDMRIVGTKCEWVGLPLPNSGNYAETIRSHSHMLLRISDEDKIVAEFDGGAIVGWRNCGQAFSTFAQAVVGEPSIWEKAGCVRVPSPAPRLLSVAREWRDADELSNLAVDLYRVVVADGKLPGSVISKFGDLCDALTKRRLDASRRLIDYSKE